MTDYLKNTLLVADSDACNSLEGLLGYADQEKALVQQQNRWFRFFAASTVAPDGVSVIAPSDITPPDPGRWIRQGIPGPVGPRPDKPVNLACYNPEAVSGSVRMEDAQAALEELSVPIGAPTPLLLSGTANPFTASISNPSPDREYWVGFDGSTNQLLDSAIFRMSASWSYNGGGAWNNMASFMSFVGGNNADEGPWGIGFKSLKTLGSALPGGGVTAGDATLMVRILVELFNGGAGAVVFPDNVYGALQLWERVP